MHLWKKIILTIAFLISLLPMLLNQYGGMKGVQEISGLINLFNPIGIISVLLFIIGIWVSLKNKKINKILGALGTIGIVISEMYKFFTWHIMNITGKMSIHIIVSDLRFQNFITVAYTFRLFLIE